jgi:hypothetical protein
MFDFQPKLRKAPRIFECGDAACIHKSAGPHEPQDGLIESIIKMGFISWETSTIHVGGSRRETKIKGWQQYILSLLHEEAKQIPPSSYSTSLTTWHCFVCSTPCHDVLHSHPVRCMLLSIIYCLLKAPCGGGGPLPSKGPTPPNAIPSGPWKPPFIPGGRNPGGGA